MAAFDWYEVTVEESPVWLREALSSQVQGLVWEPTRPHGGYGHAESVYSSGEEVFKFLYGGAHQWPHLVASGATANEVASVIRRVTPVHLVSRADVRDDIEDGAFFDRAYPVMVEIAKARGVRVTPDGDWFTDRHLGRTLYMGAKDSAVRVRMYEKGFEQLAKHGNAARVAGVSENWVRCEIQVRPTKRAAKLQLAEVPADQFWGCSRFAQDIADELLGVEVERVNIGTVYRVSDLERAEMYMLRQYAAVLRRVKEREGSWEAVGRWIGETLDNADPGREAGAILAMRDMITDDGFTTMMRSLTGGSSEI